MLHIFYTYVASVLSRCCICFVMVFSRVFMCFLQVFQTHVLSVLSVFRRMLQMFYRDRSKVDWVLHLPPRFFAASLRCLLLLPASARHPPPRPPLLDAGDIQGGVSVHGRAKSPRERAKHHGCPVRPDVSHCDYETRTTNNTHTS